MEKKKSKNYKGYQFAKMMMNWILLLF